MWIPSRRRLLAISLSSSLLCGAASVLLGVCGPFTDVAADAFCPFVLEVFYLGITTGTTPSTYDPSSAVSRLQMAAFLSRTVDGVVRRTSRRAALNQYWAQQNVFIPFGVGFTPQLLQSDGADVWVAERTEGHVKRIRGHALSPQTFTGATSAVGVLAVAGTVFVTGRTSPGSLYGVLEFQASGSVTTLATNLGVNPFGIAYDGTRIFTANNGPPGSVSIVTPPNPVFFVTPYPVVTVTAGFNSPFGALYDGANIWITDTNLLRLDASGAILQTVTVGDSPIFPVFDGVNIWVPNAGSNSVSVVRASSGAILATLTGNGLSLPASAAFDGERILVTNPGGTSVSLWKAAGLTPIGNVPMPADSAPYGACSDGLNFWITLAGTNQLVRF